MPIVGTATARSREAVPSSRSMAVARLWRPNRSGPDRGRRRQLRVEAHEAREDREQSLRMHGLERPAVSPSVSPRGRQLTAALFAARTATLKQLIGEAA